MNFKSASYLFATLSLGLSACATEDEPCFSGEPCEVDSEGNLGSPSERLRFEIEVVGHGDVLVLEPGERRCTSEMGLCSFSFPAGSQVVLQADFDREDAPGWEDACTGRARCQLVLDADSVVVASFEPEERPWDSLRARGRLPGEPGVVTDPGPRRIPAPDTHLVAPSP